jgi:hypothetical protein
VPENAGRGCPATSNSRLELGIRLEAGDGTVVTCARLPGVVGDAVVAVEPLRHGLGNAATGGMYRVRGTAGSAILKVARLPAAADPAKSFLTSDEPDHWNYWRREALAYQTGLAATAYAGAGIVVPALLEVNTRSDGGVELWLAEVYL